MTTNDTKSGVDFLKYSHSIGLTTMQGRGFYYPSDAIIGKDDHLLVVNRSLDGDNRGVRVTVCNMEGEFFGTFASFGEDDGELIWPTSIAVDGEGLVYISDEHVHRISVFDASGEFQAKWGAYGKDKGEMDGPSGMAFDAEDNLFVVDHKNSRVQKFTKDGKYITGFGSEGQDDGEFDLPWGMTIGPDGLLYVADWRNNRVQKFSPEGDFLAKYGSSGRGDGEFSRPSGVAVDEAGYMYVADWGNERVQVLDPDFLNANVEEAGARAKSDLEPEMKFFVDDPHEESSHVEKYFWAPVSIKYAGNGTIYIIESNRHRIQVYRRASAA